jgi:glucose/arabinose dehydrogenase
MTYRDTKLMRILLLVVLSALLFSSPRASTPLALTPVATGLSDPVFVTSAPGDSTRLFVVEQTGAIRVIKNGVLLGTPYIDLSGLIIMSSEQGLLGLAFHPNYQSNGYFYVNYSRNSDGATVVSRFHVSGNPDIADSFSESIVITIPQPFTNHNGGMVAFGPTDHYLYIGMGDGGNGGDPGNRAQNKLNLLGKMLRLDIDTTSGYKIPVSNPFVGNGSYAPEIWALGMRNPWRFSFDRGTGNMYIGDVGQNAYEEVDVEPSGSGGRNYGWRLKEGYHCYNPSSQCDTLAGLTDPAWEFDHSAGCAVSGGYVYRGCAMPDWQGAYFFSDYCSGDIWSFRWTGTDVSVIDTLTPQLGTGGQNIVAFGEDYYGELYVVDLAGTISKIVPDGVPSQCPATACCVGKRGNVNGSGTIDLADLSALVSYLTGGGFVLPCQPSANINGVGTVDLADLSALVSYLTGGGFALVNCP